MTKLEYIAIVAKKSGLSQKDTDIVIDSAIDTLIELLKDQDHLSFIGFGSFSTIERSAKEVRLPSTGEVIQVKAKRVVKFKAGKVLKEAVSETN